MARNRMEVWADEEEFVPVKSNRQVRKAKRHHNKDRMKNMLRDIQSGNVDEEYFDDFVEYSLDRD